MSFLDKLMGNHSQRELKSIYPIVDRIEALGPAMEALSDEELKAKTPEFKERLANGETLDDLLPEAYAVVREAANRVLGMKHYRVQLIGGIILHQGRIAEMKTGEGKTLVATLPAYLNALEGKGVHIVTVNDYLANRDAEWMGAVHRFLGLSVGVILNSLNSDERREAYACDITYATNNELGFDYLRDNMAVYEKQLVQRTLHYAIIDEVDSILIDEARTPLIISGQSGKSTALYSSCDYLAKHMQKGEREGEVTKMSAIMGEEVKETGDFIVNEKEKTVVLTESGVAKVEQYFHLNNLADAENLEIQHIMTLALRANYLMFRDKDYVVKDGQVLIVDEFTGRIMPGRRYSDGLHQSIEAKEGVDVKRESKTLATITFQNFFNKYDKTAGMTGTALTEENEFREIYGLDVIEIPPNKKVIRVDHDDLVFATHREKINAVVEDIEESHAKGQPVLVGTATIEGSEEISKVLSRKGIKHNVLNAKFHELEAEIVAQAGEKGAVTIATNMAGRGTDIKLGEGVTELGGLKIIGTQRHEARRIDNQLRGRAGRQGDPGETRFYISLEDDLMRLFGSEKMMKVFKALGHEDGMAIEHKMLSSAVEKAQTRIESNNFAIRKNLLQYDEVINEQRELIYSERRRVLKGEDMHEEILDMIREVASAEVAAVIEEGQPVEEWDLEMLNRTLLPVIPIRPLSMNKDDYQGYTREKLIDEVTEKALELYAQKEQEITEETGSNEAFREAERVFLLRVIDEKWMNHIDDMDQLRQGISLQAFAQKDPVVEYRYAGIEMFDEMTESIHRDIVTIMMHVRRKPTTERQQVAKATGTNKDESAVRQPKKRTAKKVGPNDPCPCGKTYPDGRPIKYKNCCGRGKR
ncbi:MAG: preprotein translocase subunit SecA [Lachnospiraceae bacterium]|nr:preprotein translocase subunit SecA [Lachnospiraceae bacterium]